MTDAGFANVRTILATGNVLLESTSGVTAVRKKAEAALRETIRLRRLGAGLRHRHGARHLRGLPVRARGRRVSVLRHVRHRRRWCSSELAALAEQAGPDEKISRGDGVIYWQVPKGSTLDSTIGKTMGKPRYKSSTTTRNLRTLAKCCVSRLVSMTPPTACKEKVTLSGVSETALLTLNARATEARRRDSVIDDPMAVALVDSIDFDFAKFGHDPSGSAKASRCAPRPSTSRPQSYLDRHPAATVVALAEGLQTSFWRLDAAHPDGQFRWLTVDLPPMIDVRTRLLPPSPRVSVCAQSALDYSWMDSVDDSGGVVHHRRGIADVPAARAGARTDRPVRQEISRRPDGSSTCRRPGSRSSAGTGACGPRCATRCRRCRSACLSAQAADLAHTVPGIRGCASMSMPSGTRPAAQCRGVGGLPGTVLRSAAPEHDAAGVRLTRGFSRLARW